MNPKQRNRIMIAAMLALVLLAGLTHWRTIHQRSVSLQQTQTQIAQLKKQIASDTSLRDIENLQARLHVQQQAIPSHGEVAPILEKLARDLQTLGVTERAVTTGASANLGSMIQTPISVTFKGTFQATFDWLQNISQYDRLVRVERLIVRKDSPANDAPLIITARLVTYGSPLEMYP